MICQHILICKTDKIIDAIFTYFFINHNFKGEVFMTKKLISTLICMLLVATSLGGITDNVIAVEPANTLAMVTGIDFEENSDCTYYGPALVTDSSCFNSINSHSGRSLEFNITPGNQLEAFFDAGKLTQYAAPQALVFWLKTPIYDNPTGDLGNLDIGLICGNSRWTLNQSPTAGMNVFFVSDSDKAVTKVPLKSLGGSVNLDAPSGFTGWVVIPMELINNNAWHTSETVKDFSVAPKFSFLSNWIPTNDIGKKIYIDTVGFTDKIDDFATSMGVVISNDEPAEESPYWVKGVDFEKDADANFSQAGVLIPNKTGYFSNEPSQEGRAIKAAATEGFQIQAFFDTSKVVEYTKGVALTFWLKTPTYDNPSGDYANLNIGLICGDTRWRLNQMPSEGMKVTFVSTKDHSTQEVALKFAGGSVCLDAPSDFEGWVVVPFGILGKNWGPATEIKLDKISEFNIVYEWMPSADLNKTYGLDSVGIIKDIDGFMENIAEADFTGGVEDTRFLTIARDFETSSENLNVTNGNSAYTFGISPYGRAVSFTPNESVTGPLLEVSIAKNKANYTGAKALVFWAKTSDTDEIHKFSLSIDDYMNSEKIENYQLPTETSIGQFIFNDGKVLDMIISGNQLTIPRNFEGWIVIPLDILEMINSGATDNGVLDIESAEKFKLSYIGNTRKGPYYIDEIAFTTDTRLFMESIGGDVPSDNYKIINDFENGLITNTETSTATVINDKSSITQLSLVDDNSYTGYSLKLISNGEGASAKIKNLAIDKNSLKESNALAFWVSVPYYNNDNMKMTLMIDDSTKQVNGGPEIYSLSSSSDMAENFIYTVDNLTGVIKKSLIKDNCIELESGFNGFLVASFSNFEYDTKYNANKDDGVLDLSKNTFIRVIMQTGTENLPLYIDDLTFVNDIDTYMLDEMKGYHDDIDTGNEQEPENNPETGDTNYFILILMSISVLFTAIGLKKKAKSILKTIII